MLITENPSNLAYEKLFEIEDWPEFTEEYYSDKSNITVGGVSAKLTYNDPGETHSDRIIIIPRDKYYLSIFEPRERTIDFDQFLYGFKVTGNYVPSSCEKEIKEKVVSTKGTCPPYDSECIAQMAQEKNDIGICENSVIPDECFSYLAFLRGEPKLCERVELSSTFQPFCYQRVAIKLNNADLCNNISCESYIKEKDGSCSPKNDCYERSYIEIAKNTRDPEYCDKALKYNNTIGYCYRNVAIKADDINLCDRAHTTNDTRLCYIDFGVYKENCTLLKNTKYPELQKDCEEQIKQGMRPVVDQP